MKKKEISQVEKIQKSTFVKRVREYHMVTHKKYNHHT